MSLGIQLVKLVDLGSIRIGRRRNTQKRTVTYPRSFDHVSCRPSRKNLTNSFTVESYAKGYPRMAAVYDCDANFSACRKFGWLHNRVLLHLQAELGRLEDELQDLDDEQAAKLQFKERKGLWCDDADKSKRKEMLAEIRIKLAEYDDLVFRLQKKHTMKRPTRANRSTLLVYACQNTVASEVEWTYRTDDLVALADDAAEQDWYNFVMRHARDLAPRLFSVRL